MDVSKAFDGVCHTYLFDLLNQRGVPGYIVEMLRYWYANQRMRVRWGMLSLLNLMSDQGPNKGLCYRHISLICIWTVCQNAKQAEGRLHSKWPTNKLSYFG